MILMNTQMYRCLQDRFLARKDEARRSRSGSQVNSSAKAASTASVNCKVTTLTVANRDTVLQQFNSLTPVRKLNE